MGAFAARSLQKPECAPGQRSANAGYLLDLMKAARAEMEGDLDRAVALLPDPRVAGGYPLYLCQIHAGRARVLHTAGHEARAREEFARMREAAGNSPSSATIDGIRVQGATIGQIDEALTALADNDYLQAMNSFRDPSGYFDPTGRRRHLDSAFSSRRVRRSKYRSVNAHPT